MNDAEILMMKYERQRQARRKLSQANKATVMDALAAVDISLVVISFDGAGDNGQIEEITANRGDTKVPLPDTEVSFQETKWGVEEPVVTSLTLADGLEHLCYHLLEFEHDGWGNNEGSYGEFRFDVAKRTIKLEFNARFTEVSTTHHSF